MARYEITHDGARYEITAPDETPMDMVQKHFLDGVARQQDGVAKHAAPEITGPRSPRARGIVAGIDTYAPVETVREQIAGLPAEKQDEARKTWAEAYVAREQRESPHLTKLDNIIRSIARGTFVGSALDELTGASSQALHTLSGGKAGAPYDETVAYQRARDRIYDEENLGASLAGQLGGGVAGGVGALRSVGTGPAGTALGTAIGGPFAHMNISGNLPTAVAKGGGASVATGGARRFGDAEGGVPDRAAAIADPMGLLLDASIGAAVPAVARGMQAGAEVIAPQVARAGAHIDNLRNKLAIRTSMSAPEATPAADAAAEAVIANHLARANVSPAILRERLEAADEAARFSSVGRAQNVSAPVDLDPSLQRLASSAGRKSPEAYSTMAGFQATRQTGVTQPLPLPPRSGVSARPAFARPDPDDAPMGQFERVKDAMKRALLIKDAKQHGHKETAYQTEQSIIETAREEGKQLYNAAYDLAQNVNIRPTIEPVMGKWRMRMEDEPSPVALAIRKGLRLFQTEAGPVSNLQRFDKAKQFLDGQIEQLIESPVGRNRYLAGVLTEMKNELLAAVDQVPKAGEAYSVARAAFGSRMQARDALRLGRDVFRENSEVAVDQYRALATEGERKLFRLGMLDGFEQHMGRQKRTADITQAFQSPRVQEILREVIPKTETASGAVKAGSVFGNRPERFGQFLEGERRMIATRDEVLGNSKTAQRLADDRAFDTINEMVEQIRRNPSATGIAVRTFEAMVNRVFGMRADTAAALANKLFTADPAERARVIARLELRMGPTRMAHLARMIEEHQGAITQGTAGVRNIDTRER